MNPHFSILLPTFNSKKYIKECVESILAQTYTDFTLHVVDGFSEDTTLDYIRSLNDSRIVIYTSDTPLSIEENWSRFILIPRNEFMTIIGHDDIFTADYLETMSSLIKKYPDASLYQTHFTYIDSYGRVLRKCRPMSTQIGSDGFLQAALTGKIDTMATGFMMRSKDYNDVGGIPLFYKLLFADDALWILLTQKSYLATSEKYCFSFRQHDNTSNFLLGPATLRSLGLYVNFLQKIKSTNNEARQTIEKYGASYVYNKCREIAHRIIRKPLHKRENLSVSSLITQCRSYAELLSPNSTINPLKDKNILAAKIIDSNFISRNLFILLKKMHKNPIIKK